MAAVALVARPEFSVIDFVAFIPLPLIASPKNTDSTTTFLSPRGSLRQVLTRSFLLRFRLRLACPPLYGRLCVVQIGKATNSRQRWQIGTNELLRVPQILRSRLESSAPVAVKALIFLWILDQAIRKHKRSRIRQREPRGNTVHTQHNRTL